MSDTSPHPTEAPSASARTRVTRWGLVVAWAAVIFALSAQPGSNLPGGYSYQAHLAEYAVLAVLVYRASRADASPLRAALLAILIASAYGVTDEIHQLFVPLRQADVRDWLTDTVGAVLAVAACVWLERVRPHRITSNDQ